MNKAKELNDIADYANGIPFSYKDSENYRDLLQSIKAAAGSGSYSTLVEVSGDLRSGFKLNMIINTLIDDGFEVEKYSVDTFVSPPTAKLLVSWAKV